VTWLFASIFALFGASGLFVAGMTFGRHLARRQALEEASSFLRGAALHALSEGYVGRASGLSYGAELLVDFPDRPPAPLRSPNLEGPTR